MLPLPEGFTLETMLTIGQVSMSIQAFIRYGMVKQEGSRFFQISTRPTLLGDNTPTKPHSISLRELERRGYAVQPGRTVDQDLIMVFPGSFVSIPHAIKNGLLTTDSKPNY